METATIQTAQNVKCINCHRKLCKIKDTDSGKIIEFKHKGATVLTVEAIITCVDCGNSFSVNSNVGIIEEL